MKKTILSSIALFALFTGPVIAQSEEHREHSAMQHIGGHWRHSHRDWSQQENRHVHNVCWDWDAAQGWVWNCR